MPENRLRPYVPERKRKFLLCEQLIQSILMKNTPLNAGIAAVVFPLPAFFYTILWAWIVTFGLGFGVLGIEHIPDWLLSISVTPLLLSFAAGPILGVLGIIHSLTKIKQKRAWLGLLLSILGLVESLLLVCGLIYLGRF